MTASGGTNPEEVTGGKRKGYKRFFESLTARTRTCSMNLPDSEVMQAMKMGWNRKMDDVFIDAAIAAALGGADPFNTPLPLPSSSQVAIRDYGSAGVTTR
jgi:hypothetical protein